MFTIFDPGAGGIYGPMRGRMAIFNEWVREIADRHGASVVDMWRMRDIEIAGVMDTDRMHLNSSGHTHMAHAVLEAIGVEHGLEPVDRRSAPRPRAPRDLGRQRASGPASSSCPGCTAGSPGARPATPSSPKHPALSSVRPPVR